MNFAEAWNELKSKNYTHHDGTEVLNEEDKESITAAIKEHLSIGLSPQEAARAAVKSHLEEAEAHLQDIYKQVKGRTQ